MSANLALHQVDRSGCPYMPWVFIKLVKVRLAFGPLGCGSVEIDECGLRGRPRVGLDTVKRLFLPNFLLADGQKES